MRNWTRTDTIAVAGLTAIGLLVRTWYVASMTGSPYDPWRHLVLIANLREGVGFTPFPGEPYVWYQPLWHVLCAWTPLLGPAWIAALFSAACVPLMYVWLRDDEGDGARSAAIGGAILMAAYGPVIRFTCHYGPEAFAMALFLLALVIATHGRSVASGLAAGLIVGVALVARANFLFAAPLFLPSFSRPKRAAAIAAAATVPVLAGLVRNARLLGGRDWVFTWDGLATPTSEFNPISTFMIQLHPDVAEGLRRLHELMFTGGPEWLIVPAIAAFVALAAVCLVAARRPWPAASFFATVVYMLWFDGTGSGNFYRILAGVFPAMFAGIAVTYANLAARGGWTRAGAGVLLGLALSLGLPYLKPPQGAAGTVQGDATVSLEAVIPDAGFLREERYLVNSAFYHPEALIFAHPDKRFLGLPLRPDRFDAFQRAYPEYRHVLWHSISVQDELLDWLVTTGRYRQIRQRQNRDGTIHTVLEATAP